MKRIIIISILLVSFAPVTLYALLPSHQVVVENLNRHVAILSGEEGFVHPDSQNVQITFRKVGQPGYALAGDYLKMELESYGYTVDTFEYSIFLTGNSRANAEDIFVYKEGKNHPDEILLLSAFYDGSLTWGGSSENPSADMNASGTAAILETARIFFSLDLSRSVLFAFWGSEGDATWAFKETYSDNPWIDRIFMQIDVEAIGFDTLGLRRTEAQIPSSNDQVYLDILARFDSVVTSENIDISVGYNHYGAAGLITGCQIPMMSFTQSSSYYNSHIWTHGDSMAYFDFPVFHDRVRAIVAMAAYTAENGAPDLSPSAVSHEGVPECFTLFPNYPNPFNPATTIRYSLPEANRVILNIYDITGRMVEQIINQHTPAGYHTISWDATGYSSGIYIARMQARDVVKTQKMVLMK